MNVHLFFVKKPSPQCRGRAAWFGAAFGVLLSSCAVTDAPMPTLIPVVVAPVTPPAPLVLTEAAATALSVAEERVADARAKRALWTAAVRELASARAAAKAFDSAKTIQHADEAVILCKLSIEQLKAPPVTW